MDITTARSVTTNIDF